MRNIKENLIGACWAFAIGFVILMIIALNTGGNRPSSPSEEILLFLIFSGLGFFSWFRLSRFWDDPEGIKKLGPSAAFFALMTIVAAVVLAFVKW